METAEPATVGRRLDGTSPRSPASDRRPMTSRRTALLLAFPLLVGGSSAQDSGFDPSAWFDARIHGTTYNDVVLRDGELLVAGTTVTTGDWGEPARAQFTSIRGRADEWQNGELFLRGP